MLGWLFARDPHEGQVLTKLCYRPFGPPCDFGWQPQVVEVAPFPSLSNLHRAPEFLFGLAIKEQLRVFAFFATCILLSALLLTFVRLVLRASTRWYASSLVLVTLGVLRAVGDVPFANLVKISELEDSTYDFIIKALTSISYPTTPFVVRGPTAYAVGLLYSFEFGALALNPLLSTEGKGRTTSDWILFFLSSLVTYLFIDTLIELPLIRRRLKFVVIEEYETMYSFGQSALALAALVAAAVFLLSLAIELISSSVRSSLRRRHTARAARKLGSKLGRSYTPQVEPKTEEERIRAKINELIWERMGMVRQCFQTFQTRSSGVENMDFAEYYASLRLAFLDIAPLPPIIKAIMADMRAQGLDDSWFRQRLAHIEEFAMDIRWLMFHIAETYNLNGDVARQHSIDRHTQNRARATLSEVNPIITRLNDEMAESRRGFAYVIQDASELQEFVSGLRVRPVPVAINLASRIAHIHSTLDRLYQSLPPVSETAHESGESINQQILETLHRTRIKLEETTDEATLLKSDKGIASVTAEQVPASELTIKREDVDTLVIKQEEVDASMTSLAPTFEQEGAAVSTVSDIDIKREELGQLVEAIIDIEVSHPSPKRIPNVTSQFETIVDQSSASQLAETPPFDDFVDIPSVIPVEAMDEEDVHPLRHDETVVYDYHCADASGFAEARDAGHPAEVAESFFEVVFPPKRDEIIPIDESVIEVVEETVQVSKSTAFIVEYNEEVTTEFPATAVTEAVHIIEEPIAPEVDNQPAEQPPQKLDVSSGAPESAIDELIQRAEAVVGLSTAHDESCLLSEQPAKDTEQSHLGLESTEVDELPTIIDEVHQIDNPVHRTEPVVDAVAPAEVSLSVESIQKSESAALDEPIPTNEVSRFDSSVAANESYQHPDEPHHRSEDLTLVEMETEATAESCHASGLLMGHRDEPAQTKESIEVNEPSQQELDVSIQTPDDAVDQLGQNTTPTSSNLSTSRQEDDASIQTPDQNVNKLGQYTGLTLSTISPQRDGSREEPTAFSEDLEEAKPAEAETHEQTIDEVQTEEVTTVFPGAPDEDVVPHSAQEVAVTHGIPSGPSDVQVSLDEASSVDISSSKTNLEECEQDAVVDNERSIESPTLQASPAAGTSSNKGKKSPGHMVVGLWTGTDNIVFRTDNFLKLQDAPPAFTAEELQLVVDLGYYLIARIRAANRAETSSASKIINNLAACIKMAKENKTPINVGAKSINYFRACVWIGQARLTKFPAPSSTRPFTEIPIEGIIKLSGYGPDGFKQLGMLPNAGETWVQYIARLGTSDSEKVMKLRGWLQHYISENPDLLQRTVPRAPGWDTGVALDTNRCLYHHLQNLCLWPPYTSEMYFSLARFKELKAEKKVAEGVAGPSGEGEYPPTPKEALASLPESP
ncbi:SubName: Full=Uncharacterized protein {ECO:0000313/EMBL:CCA69710.1} [Serendipita indica DSM 11827]|nr:SubName: Full=Uncharacterized protein {ECO:0000313/EMBL:CCA69710.1} [Serendipita indica DSM 11827]